MADRAPLIAKYIITATTADWQRLGAAPLSGQVVDQAALPDHPIWRVEEHVIGCLSAAVCRRDGQVVERGVCERVIVRDLTLAQAVAHLAGLLTGEVVRCEE